VGATNSTQKGRGPTRERKGKRKGAASADNTLLKPWGSGTNQHQLGKKGGLSKLPGQRGDKKVRQGSDRSTSYLGKKASLRTGDPVKNGWARGRGAFGMDDKTLERKRHQIGRKKKEPRRKETTLTTHFKRGGYPCSETRIQK